MKKILEFESLSKLEKFLQDLPVNVTRKKLLNFFLKNAIYKNADQWHNAVRACEALAIVGWGEHEPLEAEKGGFHSNEPETRFVDRYGRFHYLNATWSKKSSGLAVEREMSRLGPCPEIKKPILATLKFARDIQNVNLRQQRNWIPRNPINVDYFVANCYPKSKPLLKQVDKLTKMLDKKMRPEIYGTAINQIGVSVNLSYPIPGCSGEHYIILEEEGKFSDEKLYKMLRKKFSDKAIEENGYWLRQRYKYGGFRKAKGGMEVDIFFPKEYSDQSLLKQKKELALRIEEVVAGVAIRLTAKKLEYNFDAMSADLSKVLGTWVKLKK